MGPGRLGAQHRLTTGTVDNPFWRDNPVDNPKWRDAKYRQIDDEHRKKLIECKTTQVAPTAPPRPWAANTRCFLP